VKIHVYSLENAPPAIRHFTCQDVCTPYPIEIDYPCQWP
jgi:hypothetical protein